MARYGQNIFATGSEAYRDAWDDTQNLFDKAADRQAGRALAGGDRRKAMEVYGNAGRVDAVRTLQDDQSKADADTAAQRRQVAETLIAATDELGRLPDEKARYEALSHPIFQMLIPQEHLSQIKPEHLSDEGLAMFGEEVKRQMVNLGGGGVAEYTPGQPLKVLREPDPKLMQVREGTTVYDPETGQTVFVKPKTYAPPRAGGAGKPKAFVPQPTGKVY